MNILEALDEVAEPEKAEEFVVTLKRTQQASYLEFQGYFSYSNASWYAHYDPMALVAGSQTSDPELAKIKALFRLVIMIEHRLNTYKADGNEYRGLFEEPVPDEVKKRFINYAEIRESDLTDNAESPKIPVFSENFHRTGDGIYEIRFSKRGDVDDIAEMQSFHMAEHAALDESFPRVVIKASSRTDGESAHSYDIQIPGERLAS